MIGSLVNNILAYVLMAFYLLAILSFFYITGMAYMAYQDYKRKRKHGRQYG